jgi:3-hydroxyacyl-CoA dehydrogenase
VLGAGVMGAQIAAHLVNVKVPVVLFDLPAKEGPRTASPKGHRQPEEAQALALGVADDAELIQPANYEEHLKLLKDCDLVIEAIAERMDWKLDLYTRSPLRGQARAVASNTSGLSITKLSEALPEAIKPRFCGIHFFNPPRYMPLVELIATPTTEARARPARSLCHQRPGQGRGARQDTPNFIANRIGIAGMLATMKEARTSA